jgi:integrase
MRKRWQTTGVKAGVPGRIPHDFRRTAVQPERRGVARSVTMKITGHNDGERVPALRDRL